MSNKNFPSQAELEQARQELARYALGNLELDTTRLLLIYARQSSEKQRVTNVYSALQQTEDLIERAKMLGWTLPYNPEKPDEIAGRYLILVENAVAKKTSGTLPIDKRTGLKNILTEYIEPGKASVILAVAVDRLFRDELGVDSAVFGAKCKQVKCLIVTSEDGSFDFNNPYKEDFKTFKRKAESGYDFIEKHIKGKMLAGRAKKAEKGQVANGIAPIGLRVRVEVNSDGLRSHFLEATSHAPIVNWLHIRYRELEASSGKLLRELASMARQGKPVFPIADDVSPKSVFLTAVHDANGLLIGWTVKSRFGLENLLGNPTYQGHLVFDGKIAKRNAFPDACIVDASAWEYAYNHLATRDLDGQTIDKPAKAVRYTSVTNNALLAGNRHDGRAVIEGTTSTQRVYVSLSQTSSSVYTLRASDAIERCIFEAAIAINELDDVLETHLLDRLSFIEEAINDTRTRVSKSSLVDALNAHDTSKASIKPDDRLEEAQRSVASLQRKLDVASDAMDDDELRRNYDKLAKLKKYALEIETASTRAITHASELEQAKEDVKTAYAKYTSWDIEHKRRFIRSITDAITLESIGTSWLRLSVTWSALIGMPVIHESPIVIENVEDLPAMIEKYGKEALSDTIEYVPYTEVAFIYRGGGSRWSKDELNTLAALYPVASVTDVQQALPNRSWASIQCMASAKRVARGKALINDRTLDRFTSYDDMRVIEKYGLEPDEPVQWYELSDSNDASLSRTLYTF